MGPLFPLLLLTLHRVDPGAAGGSARGRRAGRGGPPPTPQGTPVPFWVRLSPEFIAVPPGGSVWLNCSSNCPLAEGFRLHTTLRQRLMQSGPGWATYQLVDVRAWTSNAHCLVICGGAGRWASARIDAYKMPHSVTLDPPVLENGKYTLRCHITHVFPVGFLVVVLRLGGRVLYSESLERFTGSSLANVTLTHVLRMRPLDLSLPVTCHARLSLDGLVVRAVSEPLTLPPLEWHPASKTVAFSSLGALAGVLLVVVGAYVRGCLQMQSMVYRGAAQLQAETIRGATPPKEV